MSYDLMVFEPGAAPTADRAAFMAWYDQQTQWAEPHGYGDPSVTTSRLHSWYEEMNTLFPDMNTLGEDGDFDSPRITGYTIGESVIYADFRWSVAEEAYEAVRRLAEKHGVGFFDVSADEGDIIEPELLS